MFHVTLHVINSQRVAVDCMFADFFLYIYICVLLITQDQNDVFYLLTPWINIIFKIFPTCFSLISIHPFNIYIIPVRLAGKIEQWGYYTDITQLLGTQKGGMQAQSFLVSLAEPRQKPGPNDSLSGAHFIAFLWYPITLWHQAAKALLVLIAPLVLIALLVASGATVSHYLMVSKSDIPREYSSHPVTP